MPFVEGRVDIFHRSNFVVFSERLDENRFDLRRVFGFRRDIEGLGVKVRLGFLIGHIFFSFMMFLELILLNAFVIGVWLWHQHYQKGQDHQEYSQDDHINVEHK